MMSRFVLYAVALMPLIAVAPAAAQTFMHREDLPMHERQRLEAQKRGDDESNAKFQRDMAAEREKARRALLKKPPLPAERNGLLGSWRLGDGRQGPTAAILGQVTGGGPGGGTGLDGAMTDIAKMVMTFEKGLCKFGSGVTFSPSTYSIHQGVAGRPIAYRAALLGGKPAIAAIPGASQQDMMVFTLASPDRIVGDDGCVLVRVGAPAANAAANATTAPGSARTGAANSSAPPPSSAMPQVAAVAPAPPRSTLARPSPEVCRNTLLDKLGIAYTNDVRAMSDARFKEMNIEGKVPNTNNLRIDMRGSACDDPRIKATLYDFDANERLESITYVWDRPPGPAPAPIFSERVTHLTRVLSLPPPQSPGHLQADTSVGLLILQDMPERNLMLEAYKAKQ